MTLSLCANFSDVYTPSEQSVAAINRDILVSRFGHLAAFALAWADSQAPFGSGAFFDAFSSGPRRGGNRGRYAPGQGFMFMPLPLLVFLLEY